MPKVGQRDETNSVSLAWNGGSLNDYTSFVNNVNKLLENENVW